MAQIIIIIFFLRILIGIFNSHEEREEGFLKTDSGVYPKELNFWHKRKLKVLRMAYLLGI